MIELPHAPRRDLLTQVPMTALGRRPEGGDSTANRTTSRPTRWRAHPGTEHAFTRAKFQFSALWKDDICQSGMKWALPRHVELASPRIQNATARCATTSGFTWGPAIFFRDYIRVAISAWTVVMPTAGWRIRRARPMPSVTGLGRFPKKASVLAPNARSPQESRAGTLEASLGRGRRALICTPSITQESA